MRVLVVDDSAVARRVLHDLLEAAGGFEVDTAADPLIAMGKMAARPPDALVLDLDMPRMDGLTFLRQVMRERPLPVVVVAGLATRGTELAVQALAEGAVEVIAKPALGAGEFLKATAPRFTELLRSLGPVRRPEAPTTPLAAAALPKPRRTACELLALGASTGGPEALLHVFKGLPRGAPPVVVVQHMPRAFTGPLAKRLNEESALRVQEATHGMPLLPGHAVIARGDAHLKVRRAGGKLVAELDEGPPRHFHRPSVDVLFDSVSRAVAAGAVGVLLTGMGADGAQGLLAMRRAGAWTLAQDEQSSVVFGMPKAAIGLGAVDDVRSLEELGRLLPRLSALTAR